MSHPDFRSRLVLEASISPSEDPTRVVEAMAKVVGGAESTAAMGANSARLTVDGDKSVDYIRDKLRDRHVRSAARRQLLVKKKRRSSSLMLNRQAAAVGVLAICGSPEESPLGPIFLKLESEHIDDLIDWLTSYEEG